MFFIHYKQNKISLVNIWENKEILLYNILSSRLSPYHLEFIKTNPMHKWTAIDDMNSKMEYFFDGDRFWYIYKYMQNNWEWIMMDDIQFIISECVKWASSYL